MAPWATVGRGGGEACQAACWSRECVASVAKLRPRMQKVGQRRKPVVTVTAYTEESSNPIRNAVNKLVGSLPIFGLLARLASDEGGVGEDRVTFGEFCRRVEKKCSKEGADAFARFNERHGKVGSPRFVLVWCWAAVTGAGLLRSDDIDSAALRMRASYDMMYEVECLDALMEEALKRRKQSKVPAPEVPMLTRIDKALDGICICCLGDKTGISDTDAELLTSIVHATFVTVDRDQIEELVKLRLEKKSEV